MMMVMLLMLVQLGGIQQRLMSVRTHDIVNLLAGQLIPRCGDDAGVFTGMFADQLERFIETLFADILCAAEYDRTGAFQLVVVELTEVFDIHAALGRIADCGQAAHFDLALLEDRLDSGCYIRQLADAGRLDDDAIRREPCQHIVQRFGKITDQRTADAAGIHLGNFDAGIPEKAAIYADLAKLIFNENDLLALQRTFQQLTDERGLASAEKAGDNVNFRHITTPSIEIRFT